MGSGAAFTAGAAEEKVRRGTIAWIDLRDAVPPEMGKTRPGLIISNTQQNTTLPTVVIIPLSSRPRELWPLRLKMDLPRSKHSFVVLPGIRGVTRDRILDTIGFASDEFLERLMEALAVYLGD